MAGLLLTDSEIDAEISASRLVVSPLSSSRLGKDSPIQPSSLDLTIGRIMKPPVEIDQEEQAKSPPLMMKSTSLRPGETVVVETGETITLDASLAAFGFPPAHLARNAILMTNPGHVDPGYSGKMSFTLINMGRREFYLEEGLQIVSLLIFRFSAPIEKDYRARYGVKAGERNYWEILNRLSPDFASMNQRMSSEAQKAVTRNLIDFEAKSSKAEERLAKAEQKFDRSKLWVPLYTAAAVATVSVIGTFGVDYYLGQKYVESDTIDELEQRVEAIASDLSSVAQTAALTEFDDRLDDLEDQVRTLSDATRNESEQ